MAIDGRGEKGLMTGRTEMIARGRRRSGDQRPGQIRDATGCLSVGEPSDRPTDLIRPAGQDRRRFGLHEQRLAAGEALDQGREDGIERIFREGHARARS